MNRAHYAELENITKDIKTPKAVGQFQHGSASWSTDKDKREMFDSFMLGNDNYPVDELIQLAKKDIENISKVIGNLISQKQFEWDSDIKAKSLKQLVNKAIEKEDFEVKEKNEIIEIPQNLKGGGIVLGKKDLKNGKEEIYYLEKDHHTLCIGTTRSGKGRTLVLQSIGTLGLFGESMVLSDPKGELLRYTRPFLEKLGYDIFVLDFKEPKKSDSYNFLQPIIEAVDKEDYDTAQQLASELANSIVPFNDKGEPIWRAGEMAIITASILIVVYDNRAEQHRKYQNLSNVYYFIANMCKNMKVLEVYVNEMEETHPAYGLISVQDLAPPKTRGSFYISAVMTLRHFTYNGIYNITKKSDINLRDVGRNRTAIYMVLPDYTTDFYPLASLFVNQLYIELCKEADNRGEKLKRRVNFLLDEFGNFSKIPDFDAKLTVGGGRRIRFLLVVQSIAQLSNKYGKDISSIILGNCETMVYLQSDDNETLEYVSKKLGKYTASSYSSTLSNSGLGVLKKQSSYNLNFIERSLLTVEELKNIKRPNTIVMSRGKPALMYAPDLSLWQFNKLYGLGDVEHNRAVSFAYNCLREDKAFEEIKIWNIEKIYRTKLNFIEMRKE